MMAFCRLRISSLESQLNEREGCCKFYKRRKLECVFLTKGYRFKIIPLQYFLVFLKSVTCYITVQWDEFSIEMLILAFFLFFLIIKLVFLPFSFLFRMKYQISATEYQPIRNETGHRKLTVELYASKLSVKYL